MRAALIHSLLIMAGSSALAVSDWWPNAAIGEEVAVSASFEKAHLRIRAVKPDPMHDYSWVIFDSPSEGWDLSSNEELTALISNEGEESIDTMFWAVGRNGWSAVGDFAILKPGESRVFRIDLWEKYPDQTPKIDPADVDRLQIMFRKATEGLDVTVGSIQPRGEAPQRVSSSHRLWVPELSEGKPEAGKRVKFQLPEHKGGGIYCVLYLPEDWNAEEKFPVIFEYPGNLFMNSKCYSTGLPEQCVIGYGMTRGKGGIVVSLPFLDESLEMVTPNGFGDPEFTTEYAKSIIAEVLANFGGDRENLFLTGFSRGSIACGFIGLRDNEIASYWKGIHGCQHYDGSAWRESRMDDAVERAKRFRGAAIFQTDNDSMKYAPVVAATNPEVEWVWVSSGLGFHSTAMFLDDRPSTMQLREWYRRLVSKP